MSAIDGAQKKPGARAVWAALALGALFALLVCLICLIDVGRPAGFLRDWSLGEDGEPHALIESIRKEKGMLRIEGAVPRMKTKPYSLRVGLLRETDRNEIILMQTQMVRRFDLAELYKCDDHCGFAATLSLRNLSDGIWKIALVFGPAGQETVRITEEIVRIGV